MIQNFISYLIRYRRVEINISLFFLLLGVIVFLISKVTNTNFEAADLKFLLLASVCLFFEHKEQLILNKETQELCIIEEALGGRECRTRVKIALDDIEKVVAHPSMQNVDVKYIECKVHILTKHGRIIPFGDYTRDCVNLVERINDFLQSGQNVLIKTYSPCIMKILACILVGCYILLSYLNYTSC